MSTKLNLPGLLLRPDVRGDKVVAEHEETLVLVSGPHDGRGRPALGLPGCLVLLTIIGNI